MPVMIRPHFRRLVRKTRPLSPQTQAPPWQWKDPLASPPWWPTGGCNLQQMATVFLVEEMKAPTNHGVLGRVVCCLAPVVFFF